MKNTFYKVQKPSCNLRTEQGFERFKLAFMEIEMVVKHWFRE